jgi:hypothetical protein
MKELGLLGILSLICQNIQNNFHGVLSPTEASFNLPFIVTMHHFGGIGGLNTCAL